MAPLSSILLLALSASPAALAAVAGANPAKSGSRRQVGSFHQRRTEPKADCGDPGQTYNVGEPGATDSAIMDAIMKVVEEGTRDGVLAAGGKPVDPSSVGLKFSEAVKKGFTEGMKVVLGGSAMPAPTYGGPTEGNDPTETIPDDPSQTDENDPSQTDESNDPGNTDSAKPTNTDSAKPTNTDLAKPTNTDLAKPTNTDSAKPTNTDLAKPTSTPPAPLNTDTAHPVNQDPPKPVGTDLAKPTIPATY